MAYKDRFHDAGITESPLCNRCLHFHRNAKRSVTCDAFPVRIPDDILGNIHDHHKPYPGDHGIQYEPDPERI